MKADPRPSATNPKPVKKSKAVKPEAVAVPVVEAPKGIMAAARAVVAAVRTRIADVIAPTPEGVAEPHHDLIPRPADDPNVPALSPEEIKKRRAAVLALWERQGPGAQGERVSQQLAHGVKIEDRSALRPGTPLGDANHALSPQTIDRMIVEHLAKRAAENAATVNANQ
jgi:hypothetical protein